MYKRRFFFFFWVQQAWSKLTGGFCCSQTAFQQNRCLKQRFSSVLGEKTNSEPLWACRASTLATSECSTPCPPVGQSTQIPWGQEWAEGARSLEPTTVSGDISSDKLGYVCARCPCTLEGCAAPASSVRGSTPGKGSLKAPGVCQMCAQYALCGCPACCELSPLSQSLLLCLPINLPSARTPWFPGHCC